MKYTYKIWCTLILVLFISSKSILQTQNKVNQDISLPSYIKLKPPYYHTSTAWADTILDTLTIEEKIGQLFMVAAYSNKDSNHVNHIKELIDSHHIGGLIFFHRVPFVDEDDRRLTHFLAHAEDLGVGFG